MELFKKHPLPAALTAMFMLAAIVPFLFSLSGEQGQGGLVGWGNYGQWFGFMAAIFSLTALMMAYETLKMQRRQIEDGNASAQAMMAEMGKQSKSLADAAEINGLAALAIGERKANVPVIAMFERGASPRPSHRTYSRAFA